MKLKSHIKTKYKLIRTFLILLFTVTSVNAQIPEWYKTEMERQVGTWIADNKEYQNETETDDSYVIEWKWGKDNESLNGILYGLIEGKKTNEYWNFLMFWDENLQKVRFIQVSPYGTKGEGFLEYVSENETKLTQIFITPEGQTFEEGHKTKVYDNYEISTSYKIEDGKWIKKRSYKWILKKESGSLFLINSTKTIKNQENMDKIIVQSALLNCSLDRAFDMFTNNKLLESWLTKKADVELVVGGKYELFWEPKDPENNSNIGCKILAMERPNYLNFEWKGPKHYKHFMNTIRPLTNVTVLFIAVNDKTKVTLIHTGWRHSDDWELGRQFFISAWKEAFLKLEEFVNKS